MFQISHLARAGHPFKHQLKKFKMNIKLCKHIFEQIATIHNDGGIKTNVMGRQVTLKIWSHLITGDTSGRNVEGQPEKGEVGPTSGPT